MQHRPIVVKTSNSKEITQKHDVEKYPKLGSSSSKSGASFKSSAGCCFVAEEKDSALFFLRSFRSHDKFVGENDA
jgi:hypothetical protein